MRINKSVLPAVLSLTATFALGQSHLPPNSYLDTRVANTTGLLNEMKSDQAVMDRYCRHFAMTREEVVAYLSQLRVSRLQKDGVFTVYGVTHAAGDIHAHLRLLKKGEPVFVNEEGAPILMLVCGNPLVLGPKKPAAPNPIIASTGVVLPLQEDRRDFAASEPSTETTIDSMPADAPQLTPIMPDVLAPNQPLPPLSKSDSGLIGLVLGLGGGASFLPIGSGNTSVPEPLSLIVFGAGLAAIALRRKSKKS